MALSAPLVRLLMDEATWFISLVCGWPVEPVKGNALLSKGGADDISNTAALCPNCYERILQLKEEKAVVQIRQQVLIDEQLFKKNIS